MQNPDIDGPWEILLPQPKNAESRFILVIAVNLSPCDRESHEGFADPCTTFSWPIPPLFVVRRATRGNAEAKAYIAPDGHIVCAGRVGCFSLSPLEGSATAMKMPIALPAVPSLAPPAGAEESGPEKSRDILLTPSTSGRHPTSTPLTDKHRRFDAAFFGLDTRFKHRRFDTAFFGLDTRFDYRLARRRFDPGILQWRLEVGIAAGRGERLQDEIPVFSDARSSRR